MILAPEYGGDGKTIGRCAQFEVPVASFPAHYAPSICSSFPARHVAGEVSRRRLRQSHGSWNRAPAPMAGYNILFQPFAKGSRRAFEVFADGFKGKEPLMSPADAVARPNGIGARPRRIALHHRERQGQHLARVLPRLGCGPDQYGQRHHQFGGRRAQPTALIAATPGSQRRAAGPPQGNANPGRHQSGR